MSSTRSTYSVAKLALAAKQAYDASDVIGADPIAIVGMGCRFPGGGDSPSAFWRLLAGGVDAITEIPRSRWDIESYYDSDTARPGKMNTRWGSFLDRVDLFDAAFFGISGREAAAIDPQQRLLFEVACEALEDAGQSNEVLRGSKTGVFLAIYNTDYLQALHADRRAINAYSTVGTAPCIAAGRISYHFDLRGPSIVVDTACSSSLVAVHLACESLRVRTSDLAVVGGASLILSPDRTISLTKWGFMSPEGRCKAFDAGADGWVRGEGCGVVVLRRLSDALAAGDRVLALIRGTAINQDGRSTVLTAPNGAAQAEVIREALENGRVSPADIDYVEAHGTGTVIGDPIEFEALDEIIGREPGAAPCLIGAVKANLGHLEAAAGIAGLIKTVLALGHDRIPPQLHFHHLNPLLSFDETRLRIVPGGAPWPRGGKRRFAGVSSFGFSGTNAHVVVEEAPTLPVTTATAVEVGAHLLLLSARSTASLAGAAEQYARALSSGGDLADARLEDVCFTAGVRRHHHEHRLGVVGRTREELLKGLRSHLDGERSWTVLHGRTVSGPEPAAVFVFSGQGSQWAGMGRMLIQSEDPARRAFAECAALVEKHGGPSLFDELARDETSSRLSSTSVAQPAILALQIAVATQFRAWGIEPVAVVGHSAGEVAAAHIAGALTLEDAVRIVLDRSRSMEAATDRGRMLAASLSRSEAQAIVSASNGRLSLGSVNAASAVVLSGEIDAIEECRRQFVKQGTWCQALDVRYAFHSHQMADVCRGLAKSLTWLVPAPTRVPFVSTVTGQIQPGESLTAAYWERNALETVHFHAAMETLARAGHLRFVEIGPHPVLGGYIASTLDSSVPSLVIGSLHRRRDDRVALRATAGALHVAGIPVDLKRLLPRAQVVSLPTYAWDRQPHWAPEFDAAQLLADTHAGGRAPSAALAPLIDREVETPWNSRRVFEVVVNAARPGYVADHRIAGLVLFPAAGFLAIAQSAAARALGPEVAIEDVSIHRPLVLATDDRVVQIGIEPRPDGTAVFEIVSRGDSAGAWVQHVSGRLRVAVPLEPRSDASPSAGDAEQAPSTTLDAATFYASLREAGIDFGPAFQCVQTIAIHDDEATVHVTLPGSASDWDSDEGLHPVLFDGCMQGIGAITAKASGTPTTLVPVAFGRIRHRGRQASQLIVRIKVSQAADGLSWNADVVARDEAGNLVTEIERLVLAPYAAGSLDVGDRSTSVVQRVEWLPVGEHAARQSTAPCAWLILADRGGVGRQLASQLTGAGHTCRLVLPDPVVDMPDAAVAAPTDSAAVSQVVTEFVDGTEAPRRVLHLWSLDASWPGDAEAGFEDAFEHICAASLHVMQAIASAPGAIEGVTLVTRSAQAAEPNDETNPVQSLAWGLGRVIDLEFPEIDCRRIDLPASEDNTNDVLLDELLRHGSERELAWSKGRWLAPRVCPVPADRSTAVAPVMLDIAQRGLLDNLRLVEQLPRAPERGEVQIRVHAAGLNFRDVLNALGMYPGEAGPLGNECVGEITEVGREVVGFKPGDRVAAVGSACFATFVTTKASLVAPLPPALDAIDAATVPITFLTADAALVELAKLQAGERVLVHAGAGGVGLAAIQIARRIGAEVYATAGSPEKRAYLRSLGVRHVADSRSTEFADEIRRATGGRGVDVVLNSLAGEFIPRSIDILAPAGRFIDIGKTGVWDRARVHARRPDVAYWVYYLGDVIDRDPATVGDRLKALLELCGSGELQPLPRRVFPLDASSAAFRFMAQARHIGKVVLAPERRAIPARLRADGAYLVTGGLGALGLHAARWLIEHGARHLVLTGRSLPDDLGAVDELRRLATVDIERSDVTSAGDVRHLISSFGATRPALRGIVHAAGALHDGMLARQAWPDFRKGLGAKVLGTWHLHGATARLPLDFFVCYSSVASVIGSPGQASYTAANAFMDGFAHVRRAEGLPALSIGWGAWQRGGMVARLSDLDRERWAAEGFRPLSDADADTVLNHVAALDQAHALAVPVNWQAYVARHPVRRALLATVLPTADQPTRSVTVAHDPTLATELARLPDEDRRPTLMRHVRGRILKLVGLPADRVIDERLGFREVGLDSLLAVELRNALQADLNLVLPATMAFDYPTLATLAEFLLGSLGFANLESAGPGARAASDVEGSDGRELNDLSEEEAQALLEAELDALGRTRSQAN